MVRLFRICFGTRRAGGSQTKEEAFGETRYVVQCYFLVLDYFEGFIIKANNYRPNSSLYVTALSVKIAIYYDFDKFRKRTYSQC